MERQSCNGPGGAEAAGARPEPSCPLLALPDGCLEAIFGLLQLPECAATMLVARGMREAATGALRWRRTWSSSGHHEVSHLKASRLFKFLARHSPGLLRISCCFAADRLYGGSLLESSLSALAASAQRLSHLTLLNCDVTDGVLQQLARHCGQLQHVAIGRTENNAFGNFVSDEGLASLAASCSSLQSLCLFRCYSCSNAGLGEMCRQGRQLTRLVLHSCPQVTSEGLVSFLEHTPGLLALDVLLPESGPGGGAVSFETCFALAANCSGLRVLRISEELLSGGVLDDACMTVVARGCRQLQELELVQVEVSDSGVSCVAANCTQLTSLRLEQTYASDEGVERLVAACPGLRELRVAGCSTHSWMLPAEYMFVGLSIGGLRRLAAAGSGAGAHLTSLDLSCLALEQAGADAPTAPGAAPVPLGPAAAAAAAPAAAAAAAAAPAAAGAAVGAPAGGAVASAGGGAADGGPTAAEQPRPQPPPPAPLVPEAWCARLRSLSLDWLKAGGDALQAPLAGALSRCHRLARLSLAGYQGSVDALLDAAASAGAALTHLNLQHSQVTNGGLAAAARAFPGLACLHLCCARNVDDAGVLQLLSLGALAELDLYNTPCVSTAAVAKLARHCMALQKLYIGHNTSALHRSPATATAMGFISGSSASSSRFGGANSSVWSAATEAAAARAGAPRLAVLCRNPSSESEFEKRTLRSLLQAGNR